MPLDLFSQPHIHVSTQPAKILNILNLNIQNPSVDRAHQQLDWMLKVDWNIMILTEAKFSKGCLHIANVLGERGYKVHIPDQSDAVDDYAVFIATKNLPIEEKSFSFLSHSRINAVRILSHIGWINVLGIYVPTHSEFEPYKNDKKMKFQNQFISAFSSYLGDNKEDSHYIIGGDFNVIEPANTPRLGHFHRWEYFYNQFAEWGFQDGFRALHPHKDERSWSGRMNSFRLDHLFTSKDITPYIVECFYAHETRSLKLSDHSAMVMNVEF